MNNYNAIVLAVAHNEFKNLDIKTDDKKVVYDIKSILDKENVDGRL
jgi:UDP-N-acetyl-D-galactosamine dehydrogenase